MVAMTMTTRRLRTSACSTVAAHVGVQPAMPATGGAPAVARYRCVIAPVFLTVQGTGLSMTGAVNPISKAAVLGDTPGTSTWSPPV